MKRHRFSVVAVSALLATGLGFAEAAQQKPAPRAAPALPAAGTMVVHKSPT